MTKPEIATETPEKITHVRWEIPDDCMEIITAHQQYLEILWKKKVVSQQAAAIDLIRNKKLPKIIITHE